MKKDLVRIVFVLGFIGMTAAFGFAQTYPNPTQQETNEWRTKGPCSDPWVSKAVSQANASVRLAHSSNGSDGECDVSQYNNGSWSSYDQLRKAVDKRRDELSSMGVYYDSYKISNLGKALLFLENGTSKIIAASLVGNDGASLIGNDSAGIKTIINRLVAAGGGNLVAAGGGNLVNLLKANGAVVPTNAGNLSSSQMDAISRAVDGARLISNLSNSFSSPGAYTLKAGEKSVLVKLGSSYIRVKK